MRRNKLTVSIVILCMMSWILVGFIWINRESKQNNVEQLAFKILDVHAEVEVTRKLYTSMITGRKNIGLALSSYNYWMTHLNPQNNFIITSNDTVPQNITRAHLVPISNARGSRDDYESAQFRFLESIFIMRSVASRRRDKNVKWFFITDDDTFVIPLNLFKVISDLELLEQKFIIAGAGTPDGMKIFGGGGILLNKFAADSFVENCITCKEFNKKIEFYDVTLASCVIHTLSNLGISQKPFIYEKRMMSIPPSMYPGVNYSQHASFHYIKKDEQKEKISNMYPKNYFTLKN